MRKIAIAEWILALTMPPERAATTAGDLVESGALSGAMRFWSNVVGTMLSQLLQDLIGSPLSMLWLAFRIYLGSLLFLAFFIYSISFLFGVPYFFGHSLGHWLGLEVQVSANATQPWPNWGSPILKTPLEILFPVLVGWLLANRSRGRELSAALALNTLLFALHVVALYASAQQVSRIGMAWPGVQNSMLPLVLGRDMLMMSAGALLARVRNCATALAG